MLSVSDWDSDQPSLGKNLKLLRMQRRLSAKALAEKIDVSPSLISKIETGATNPSMDVLRKIVMHLQVTMAELMEGGQALTADPQARRERGYISVVRTDERKLLHLPKRGITYQMLTPDAQGAAEFVWVEIEPGEGGAEFLSHQKGEESLLVLEGALNVYIGEAVFTLGKGDCITFDATLPHRYRNEGMERAVYIYLAVPPTL
jgi:transcriptional regulator with XRE-family HTH domain